MTEPGSERRYWVWLGVLLVVLLVGGTFWYRWSRRAGGVEEDPYRAVPADAFLIAETTDLPGVAERWVHGSRIWDELSRIPEVGKIAGVFARADSLFSADRDLYRLFRGGPLLVSFHDAGKKDAALLGVMRLPSGATGKDVAGVMASSGLVERQREYNGVMVRQVVFAGSRRPFFFAVKKGLMMISPDRILLEKAIRQVDARESLGEDLSFRELRKTAGRNELLNLFVRADRVPAFLRGWLNAVTLRRLSQVMLVGGWTELDMTVKEKAVLLNGFTITKDSAGYLLSLLEKGEPQPCDIFEVIPTAAITATVLSFGDAATFRGDLQRYREKKGKRTAGDAAREKVVNAFAGMVTRQAAHVVLGVKNVDEEENHFVVAAVKSRNAAVRTIETLLRKYNGGQKDQGSFVRQISFDQDTRITVYRLPFEGIPQDLFGGVMGDHPYRYLMIAENYMVWGNSVKAVTRFFRFNLLQQTLSHDPDFRNFADGMTLRSNLFAFVRVPEAMPLVRKAFGDKFVARYKEYVKEPVNFRYIGYEAISQNGMIYNNIYLYYSEREERPAVTVWESLLDTLFDYKPQLVLNHRTRQREIFLQDLAGKIYLINASGRILWRLPLRKQILGQAWQIDFYRNGKLQFLFNTRQSLYLIDRNGNHVARFPVALRSPASGPLALFDYGKTRNYRIFIPGEDGRVYLYDKTGNLVPGWKVTHCESPVRGPIRHFVYRGKDYIVFTDTMNLYILDRRGNVRVPVRESILRPPHQEVSFAPFPGEREPSFVVNSTGGEVCFVSLTGKVRRLTFRGIPDEAWFVLDDLNGDGRREYIFVYDDLLQVMEGPDKELFSRKFPGSISRMAPVVYTFSRRDRKIGVTDATHADIYLVNNDGSLYEGFPMKGRTQFSIGRLGPARKGFNLIVGGEDNFLYNYSVK